MNRYKAVIFDLDGTLRESHPRFMDALRMCMDDLGMHVDAFQWVLAERWVHCYWAQSPELIEDAAQGEDGVWNRFLSRLIAYNGHPAASHEEVVAFAEHMAVLWQATSHVMPGAIELLTRLRQTGVVLGVVSNRRHSFAEELETLGLAQWFDFTLAAGEVGVWKPQPGIFTAALERAGGLAPAQAVYIGDNYYADIVGAQNAGLDAILLNDRGVFTDMECAMVTRLDEVVELVGGPGDREAGRPGDRETGRPGDRETGR